MIPIKNFTPIGIGPTKLPLGYTECEYIESTGTQWIETEIPAQINVKLQGKIQFPDGYYEDNFSSLRVSGGTASRYYLLTMDATLSKYVGLVCTKYDWGYAASMNKSDGVASPVEFESYIGDTSCYIKVDSAMYENNNVPSGVPTNKTIPLFGGKLNNSDVVTSFSPKTRLWYARLLVNDELVRNFIPCLDANRVPCMYDTVSRKTFYNQGTGAFNYNREVGEGMYLYDASDFVKGECYTWYGDTTTSTFSKTFLDGETHSGIIYAANELTKQYSPIRWECSDYHIIDHLVIGNDVSGTSSASVYGITDDGTYELIGEGPGWIGTDTIEMTKFKPYKKFELRCHRPDRTNRVWVYWIDAVMRH